MKPVFRALRSNTHELFHRPSSNLAPVDGIRALSMLGVVMYHIFFLIRLFAPPEQFRQLVEQTPWYLGWAWTLDYSVDAFFVISGYLIATLLYREHSRSGTLDLKRFYWRRYLRLTPAYFAFIGIYLLLSPRPEPNLWANLLYVNNFITLPEMSIPWTWSLAVEEQFYLLFPLLLLWVILKSRTPLLMLVLLLAASFVIATLVAMQHDVMWNKSYVESFYVNEEFLIYYDSFYVNLHTRFGPFVSGAIAAYLLHYHANWVDRLRARKLLFNGLSVLALAALFWTLGSNPYTGEPSLTLSRWHLVHDRNLFGIALAWVILASLGPAGILKPLQHFLSLKFWYPFAQLSYSMYLMHYGVVILVLANLLANLKHRGLVEPGMVFPYEWLIPAFLVAVLLSFPLSMALYVLVEKPFMHLRDRLTVAKSQAAPALSSSA